MNNPKMKDPKPVPMVPPCGSCPMYPVCENMDQRKCSTYRRVFTCAWDTTTRYLRAKLSGGGP